ncbi:MAG: cytochrome c-type biogenesis protein CcmH [Alphaproteobacteria bacterium]|nr:cytochrome c-type biogenesis protein CcmH [Alphaproteobacteria bacterium]
MLTYAMVFLPTHVSPVAALSAEEILDDPALEARARAISQQLRCLVCQNQSIDDSDAPLAKDLRSLVREQLQNSKSDTEILDFLQNQYGAYILLEPPISSSTWVLWLAPVMIALFGSGMILASRHLKSAPPDTVLPISTPRTSFRPRIVFLMCFVVLGSALGVHQFIGRPDLPPRPLGRRAEEIKILKDTAQAQQRALRRSFVEARAATRLSPKDPAAWYHLSRTAAALGDSETEINTLKQAIALDPDALALKSLLAEAYSRVADEQITLPARALIDEVLSIDSTEPRALFLRGLAAFQDGDYTGAVQTWMQLFKYSAPDAPWMPMVRENILRAAAAGDFAPPFLPDPAPIAKMTDVEQ